MSIRLFRFKPNSSHLQVLWYIIRSFPNKWCFKCDELIDYLTRKSLRNILFTLCSVLTNLYSYIGCSKLFVLTSSLSRISDHFFCPCNGIANFKYIISKTLWLYLLLSTVNYKALRDWLSVLLILLDSDWLAEYLSNWCWMLVKFNGEGGLYISTHKTWREVTSFENDI